MVRRAVQEVSPQLLMYTTNAPGPLARSVEPNFTNSAPILQISQATGLVGRTHHQRRFWDKVMPFASLLVRPVEDGHGLLEHSDGLGEVLALGHDETITTRTGWLRRLLTGF